MFVQTSNIFIFKILQVLLEHSSIKPDLEDKDGRTPLLWAASAGSEKAVLQLVSDNIKNK